MSNKIHISSIRKKQRIEFKLKWGTYKTYISSIEWNKKKEEFKKDWNGKCEFNFIGCLIDKKIEVHHKHYKNLGFEERKDVNLVCHFCHHENHKGRPVFPYDLESEEYDEEKERSWQIFNALVLWRSKKLKEEGWGHTFNNNTLRLLSEKTPRPITLMQFRNTKGVGPINKKYGEEIIKIISDISSDPNF